ncbi:5616_t:CDS:1, partial [Funneliformis geosporum]
ILRLPYFNLIRYLVIDLMHYLFLGIAYWIVKRLWSTKIDLVLLEEQAKIINLPADLGQIPNKISIREGFSSFIADQ